MTVQNNCGSCGVTLRRCARPFAAAVAMAAVGPGCDRAAASASACGVLAPLLAAGFSDDMDAHGLTIMVQASATPGEGSLTTIPVASGDFTVMVTVSRTKLANAYLGIAVGNAKTRNALLDVFYAGSGQVAANVFNPDGSGRHTNFSVSDTGTEAQFWITQKSNVITAGETGQSGVVVTSMGLAGYAVPAVITLFLVLPADDGIAQQGRFSKLDIKAPNFQARCWWPSTH